MEDKKQMIEDFAWEIFLMKSGLRFKRELTPEEKKSIIDKSIYKQYQEQAEKMYVKKIKALDNKKYPIIKVEADGGRGRMGGAYCLCFVYSKYNGNFVLKGYLREVDEYLKKNFTHYFCNKSLWHHGFNRDIWDFWKENVGIFRPSRKEKRKGEKIEVRPYSNHNTDKVELKKKTFHFKRLPKHWIPEFDVL